jgi:phosphoadenosine phosphosulfate reductase
LSIRWCGECGVPLLSDTCSSCGSRGGRVVTPDLSPVFAEEINCLAFELGASDLANVTGQRSLWASGVHYYGLGRRLMTLRALSSGIPRLEVLDSEGVLELGRDEGGVRSAARRFLEANLEHMQRLEEEATSFIRETIAAHPNHAILVAFSGGKDSTATSVLCRKALGHSSVIHIFSDTTIEAPDTYEYLNRFQKENPRVPLVRVGPTVDFHDMCSEIGPPSRILRWCCSTHKAAPMAKVVSALAADNAGVLTFDGIRAAESTRRSKYSRITHDAKIRNEVLASPILQWNDLEVWAFLLSEGVDFNRGYRRGFRRVGCLPCPLNSHWSEFLAGLYYPEWYSEWRAFLENHAERLGHPNPPQFSREGWRARAGGNGLEHQRASLRKETCETEARTHTYELVREWTDAALEYLKPLGVIRVESDDGVILRFEILDKKTRRVLASGRVSRPRSHVRITFAERSNLRLHIQRVERQLRKYQSCVQCGSCPLCQDDVRRS